MQERFITGLYGGAYVGLRLASFLIFIMTSNFKNMVVVKLVDTPSEIAKAHCG